MNKNIDDIVEAIDTYLEKNSIIFTNPVDVSKYLNRKGLLKDSKDRPGLPLRALLRKGLIKHAFQEGRKWLIPKSGVIKKTTYKKTSTPEQNKVKNSVSDLDFIKDEKAFISASNIDNYVPERAGYYCIRIKNINELPDFFSRELEKRGHNILYIGLASKSLKKRMLNQELRAKGHGTFFRSIGAVLDFRPQRGSLSGKKSKNYKFNLTDQHKIIQWINENLMVHWTTVDFVDNNEETSLIHQHKPLLNIAKNPLSLNAIESLRKECLDIARARN
tara:strand:+ start:29 stop:853 length:825 start_codon:yes stop_codon:yes gene_type:complete